ncbi:hypothetical protein [Vibrio vulnificus YJ016]|uniref:Uncharacterized protein n=1 Tax=Vibrio vulnificus (strain YJ016) TaxID=196600 RepID=Q7MPF9_VIBVY|nr:hypothetical protein [Vibrio vulnificus YJ016]
MRLCELSFSSLMMESDVSVAWHVTTRGRAVAAAQSMKFLAK